MQTLSKANVSGKRVLVRVDFNVSLDKEGRVLDDFRIRGALPTLQYLKNEGAKIILMSHLGRPGGPDSKFSLAPIAKRLQELLGDEIKTVSDCVGENVSGAALQLQPGEILLLENLRFHEAEEKNDPAFAVQLAELGEVYVNDAFGVSHRAHASVEAVAKILPAYAGFLLEKEIQNLLRVRDNPDHPLCVIIGGVKISTKIKLIKSFFGKADDMILGGALANTVLGAKGVAIGKSIVEPEMYEQVRDFEITSSKIHLPVDAVLCGDKEGVGVCQNGPIGKVEQEQLILDIGPDSRELFSKVISQSKMVIWNGAMGMFENPAFQEGTKSIARAIAASSAYSIVGGGETITYLEQEGLINKFSFASTGGGAMMEFLAGDKLPGIEALEK